MAALSGDAAAAASAADQVTSELQKAAATVISLAKIADSMDRKDWVTRACESWQLAPADVQFFFSHAKSISSVERHHAYSTYQCEYAGWVQIGNRQYQFRINGGSFGVVFDATHDVVVYMDARSLAQDFSHSAGLTTRRCSDERTLCTSAAANNWTR
ncbi:MAG: hypothetical protein ACREVI_09570 [Steroidobacteraceae bacterium]